jgi:hypothetical protein
MKSLSNQPNAHKYLYWTTDRYKFALLRDFDPKNKTAIAENRVMLLTKYFPVKMKSTVRCMLNTPTSLSESRILFRLEALHIVRKLATSVCASSSGYGEITLL